MYVRQLRDWKGSVDVACLDADGLSDYGRLCGWTLAKAHARSGVRWSGFSGQVPSLTLRRGTAP